MASNALFWSIVSTPQKDDSETEVLEVLSRTSACTDFEVAARTGKSKAEVRKIFSTLAFDHLIELSREQDYEIAQLTTSGTRAVKLAHTK